MIETDKRNAIFLLHQEGMKVREIARRLGVSRNSVRAILRQGGAPPRGARADKQRIDEELLRRLYAECEGWVARMQEKLVEEEGIPVSYSTLTRMLRELGIGKGRKPRSDQVPDEPGVEMQHDTTLYWRRLGGRRVPLIASMLYLRYSKRRYLRFYRAFDRFKMKCFFHEALMFWGHAARRCIIDNTNLARLRGVGHNALIVPEMEAFGKQYGFVFRCHELKHSNRKAGEERSFWTVETNFLPGRSFQDLEDINRQAFEWCTVRMENKLQGKRGKQVIPSEAFDRERPCLIALPPHLPAPYRVHERTTDQYGHVCFDANYFWAPETHRAEVKVLEYGDRLKIYQARECLVEYPLPADGVRDAQFSPPGLPAPRHHASNRRHPTQAEENHLRGLAPAVGAYLDFALSTQGIQRHEFIRKLLALSRRMSVELLTQTLERACTYRITSLETVERIALLYLEQGSEELPSVEIDEAFRQREAYQEGALTDPPDLSHYNEDTPDENE